jgi:tetratricopeptide (TPR) repeat protein
LIVTRSVLPVIFALLLLPAGASPQQVPPPPPPEKAPASPQAPDEDNPPEEDEGEKPKVYSFNPIQAKNEIDAGNVYWHKGSYRGAARRYEEATKWNPGMAEAFFRLGEAREKLKEKDAARAAFTRVVQLAADSKWGHEAKRKLAGKL